MTTHWSEQLSKGELHARLVQRGVLEEMAEHLVDTRDQEMSKHTIVTTLGD